MARVADVSTATVSRVLNEKPGVAEATRARVTAALQALGYHQEPVAESEPLIAVTVPELGNPTFTVFAEEISIQLSAAGWNMILCTAGPRGAHESQYIELLIGLGVAGVVSVSGSLADRLSTPEHYHHLEAAGIPAVFVNCYQPGVRGSFFSSSDAEAVAMSVAHLRAFGHTRIGLAVGQLRYMPAERKAEAFRALGFPEESAVSTTFTVEGGQAAAARLLDSGHTALLCGSDVMALGAIREAHSRGLDVPGDVSVVGYDDSALMPFTSPALTTVRQPVPAMARAAVDALLAAINGLPADPTELLFHPDLIIRQSTGPVRPADPPIDSWLALPTPRA